LPSDAVSQARGATFAGLEPGLYTVILAVPDCGQNVTLTKPVTVPRGTTAITIQLPYVYQEARASSRRTGTSVACLDRTRSTNSVVTAMERVAIHSLHGGAPREVQIKRVERWRDSGLSANDFAEQADVDSDRLRYWKWRLAKESAAARAAPVKSEASRRRLRSSR
jgi:hypothetical protein